MFIKLNYNVAIIIKIKSWVIRRIIILSMKSNSNYKGDEFDHSCHLN